MWTTASELPWCISDYSSIGLFDWSSIYGQDNLIIQDQGRCTYDVHNNCLIFKTPNSLVHLRLKFPHWLWTSNFKRNPSPFSNKLWNKNRTVHVNESKQKQNQVTSHSNWPRAQLFDLVHKQCNGITRWLHCLKPVSIGRFLVNNILMLDTAITPHSH